LGEAVFVVTKGTRLPKLLCCKPEWVALTVERDYRLELWRRLARY